MAEVVVQTPGPDGIDINLGDAASGDVARTGDRLGLLVQNSSGSTVTVTLAVPGNTVTGEAQPDNPIPVAAGALRIIPLLSVYADPADNRRVAISYSATTNVKRAVVRL